MDRNKLYSAVIAFEEGILGRHLRDFLQRDREYKIERLIEIGCQSTDKDVARIAWSLTFDSGIMAEIKSIKDGVETPGSPGGNVPEYR